MDVVKALKEIMQHHTEVLSDNKTLRAMLKDFFPEDKRTQNTLLMVVDEGILEDMQGKSRINKFQMFGYIKGIASDYGVSEQVAKSAIMNWAKALGIDAEDVPVELSSMTTRARQVGETVDYSSVGFEEVPRTGKILKFAGKGHRVVANVKLESGTYAVKTKGKPRALFYDANNKETRLWGYSDVETIIQTKSLNTSKPGYMKFEPLNADDAWSCELIKIG